ncbi:unnamed protein product [Amaranthus hypochondriacus]
MAGKSERKVIEFLLLASIVMSINVIMVSADEVPLWSIMLEEANADGLHQNCAQRGLPCNLPGLLPCCAGLDCLSTPAGFSFCKVCYSRGEQCGRLHPCCGRMAVSEISVARGKDINWGPISHEIPKKFEI